MVDSYDVVFPMAHFLTQARGSNGISHLVIARALPFLAPGIFQITNASSISGIIPEPWRESLLVASKKLATPYRLSSYSITLFSPQGIEKYRFMDTS